MNIHGLQKMTLLDFPGRVACTVFLGGCDYRCPFCHNFELIDGTAKPVMDDAELLSFLKKRQGLLGQDSYSTGHRCTCVIRRMCTGLFLHKITTNNLCKLHKMHFSTIKQQSCLDPTKKMCYK